MQLTFHIDLQNKKAIQNQAPSFLGTESCIRLYDLDEDGLEDVIIGLQLSFAQKNYMNVDEMKTTCQEEGEFFFSFTLNEILCFEFCVSRVWRQLLLYSTKCRF